MVYSERKMGDFLDSRRTLTNILAADEVKDREASLSETLLLQATSHLLLTQASFKGTDVAKLTGLQNASISPTLNRFEKKYGLLQSVWQSNPRGGAAFRIYIPTHFGELVLGGFQKQPEASEGHAIEKDSAADMFRRRTLGHFLRAKEAAFARLKSRGVMERGRIETALLLFASAVILETKDSMYGLEVIDLTGSPSGSIYPTLGQLESCGLFESKKEDIDPKVVGRPAQRIYAPTEFGKSILELFQEDRGKDN